MPPVNPPPQPPAVVRIESPADFQVFQRQVRLRGSILLRGEAPPGSDRVEVRVLGKSLAGDLPDKWEKIALILGGGGPPIGPMAGQPRRYQGAVPTTPGGWYSVEVRAMKGDQAVATARVEHVGVGEVFLVGGQANASNRAEGKSKSQLGLVSAFSGERWQPAEDPMPGVLDGSPNGSIWPAFGDALVQKLQVPVAICSVAKADSTLDSWKPEGEGFKALAGRMKTLGPGGFRAILWQQDELDAKTTAQGYASQMTRIIIDSQQAAGWACPWFVAHASYQGPSAPKNQALLDGQRKLWTGTIKAAHPGPDTDALTGDNRSLGGNGPHFSAKGQAAAGALWADAVATVLTKVLNKE
jgi:hypothetical protein